MRTLRKEMFRFRRNKSEIIVLTGAIYSFVAYLTAFILEVLFLIDLTRRSNEILAALNQANDGHVSSTLMTGGDLAAAHSRSLPILATFNSHNNEATSQASTFDRFSFESMQAHTTVSCLAISILYFVIFITSLILIVALILNSTFMLLIWMCAMATLYLPELGMVAYVAAYCWGLDTRNGQVELAFYLLRALLNLIFIVRTHKLYKQWNYEKNFFRLKSGGRTSAVSSQFAGYDSPYFIGDSLTTTINPVFSSSTLNLSRYDYVNRDQTNQPQGQQHQQGSSRGTSPTTNNSVFTTATSSDLGFQPSSPSPHDYHLAHLALATGRGPAAKGSTAQAKTQRHRNDELNHGRPQSTHAKLGKFYLGDIQAHQHNSPEQDYQDEEELRVDDYETNDHLGYRTSAKAPLQRHIAPAQHGHHLHHQQHLQRARHYTGAHNSSNQMIMRHNQPPLIHNYAQGQRRHYVPAAMSRSQDNLSPSYSTQSLDRRQLRDFGPSTEQVVLRPLGHQPFEYLHRPGSTSQLNAVGTNPKAANDTHRRDHNYQH